LFSHPVTPPSGQLEPLEVGRGRVGKAIAGGELVGEVVEGAFQRLAELMCAAELDRVLEQPERLLIRGPPP